MDAGSTPNLTRFPFVDKMAGRFAALAYSNGRNRGLESARAVNRTDSRKIAFRRANANDVLRQCRSQAFLHSLVESRMGAVAWGLRRHRRGRALRACERTAAIGERDWHVSVGPNPDSCSAAEGSLGCVRIGVHVGAGFKPALAQRTQTTRLRIRRDTSRAILRGGRMIQRNISQGVLAEAGRV